MSAIPFYFCIAALTVLLMVREWQHNRTQRALLDRILEQHGLEPLPDNHPLADVVANALHRADEPEPEDRPPVRTRFRIPGMDVWSAMNKRLPVKK